jgi:hypothetical protein
MKDNERHEIVNCQKYGPMASQTLSVASAWRWNTEDEEVEETGGADMLAFEFEGE